MRIGIDFDNTIVCYDRVFNRVAQEMGLIPASLPQGKNHVRDYLRGTGREEEWTRLQGIVYGTRLGDAHLYKGVRAFLDACREYRMECVIISHKTRYPYLGEKHDLHESARRFIRERQLGVDAFFEFTMEEKVERIRLFGCDLFIDDLPEFLQLPGFPPDVKKVLFDPHGRHSGTGNVFCVAGSWGRILSMLGQGAFDGAVN